MIAQNKNKSTQFHLSNLYLFVYKLLDLNFIIFIVNGRITGSPNLNIKVSCRYWPTSFANKATKIRHEQAQHRWQLKRKLKYV